MGCNGIGYGSGPVANSFSKGYLKMRRHVSHNNNTCRLHAVRAALYLREGISCRLLRCKLLRLRLHADSSPFANAARHKIPRHCAGLGEILRLSYAFHVAVTSASSRSWRPFTHFA